MTLRPLRSRIQYKIVVPFLLLTLLVALAGSTAAFLFVTGNAQKCLITGANRAWCGGRYRPPGEQQPHLPA